MLKTKFSKSVEIGEKTLTLQAGGFAGQTDAAVLGQYGDTMVLVTVVSAAAREGIDYFPLSIEYVERLYAGGRIKGSRWVKREGRPSDEAILKGRIIDRSIRPLFPMDYKNEVQVVITILSVDLENDPDVLSLITTSAALMLSSVPWNGPVGAVRVGLKEGTYFTNPINADLAFSELEFVVASTKEKVLMIEGQGHESSNEAVEGAVEYAKKEAAKVIDFINDFVKEAGVKEKQKYEAGKIDPELKKAIEKKTKDQLEPLMKKELDYNELAAALIEEFKDYDKNLVAATFEKVVEEATKALLISGKRPDGRGVDEIRKLNMEVGILPRTHGSAIFTRGQTQVLNVTTLGAPSLEQLIESAEGEESKRFIHHYSMPPYSSGETGRFGTPSRREIGHGALVERALEPVIPSADKFPYTIRLVSEVLSSNGSTSMASTCSSSLSLMDAGVPIKAHVAGIAMGLITDKDKFTILTDIAGIEDHSGEMDFKVAGTSEGITAVQLDVKNDGLTNEMIKETLSRAKVARLFILEKMNACISQPREKVSQYAPKVVVIHIPVEKIGEVIGPGGKMIRRIIEETGCNVEVEDDGSVNVSGTNEEGVKKAIATIEGLTREVKPGEEFEGTVKRVQPFGAFVEIMPGKEGLVHVSQMSTEFVDDPGKLVSVGQKVKVRVTEIDELHRINLSMLFGDDIKKAKPREFRPPRKDFDQPRRPHW
ncbi:polyribonucleotide nucleotidyltransferase [Candidatus Shapirobacteria bacterium CG08_land_8_20_14_0_20_39_18]|uniref:Polyribonucleotide nucleotidyltransferase n=1 Tax=Candidatus Shapirobacteria bacterium CG08_land_8_20_14_0_20_39_18 TaxID=1974883 RepID=A0A2M6XDI4_9BACT|nr:MAG: polyribonucleotide nucleotidyltransferase [Candidatus Shapirobacteria bacterium CG08_land_8_20_14_0_20_39_18]PIY65210.1 MAG: polyribonucleotide nucleotidyltransferase [Candidatus Shapirobacteria bacterium CG_4_10_14_0_8_um_filter_39_15]